MLNKISLYLEKFTLNKSHLKHYLKNPHIWIIGLLMVLITVFYYLWHPIMKASMPAFWFLVFEIKNSVQGALYFIPFAYAATVLRIRGVIITYLFALVIALPHISYLALSGASIVVNVLYSMIPLLVIILITVERNWRESMKNTMIAREQERQIYMSQIFKAQEDERQRIANELHDDITQMLMVVAHDVRNLTSSKELSSQLKSRINKTREEIIEISSNVRRLSLDMRPSILDDIGLVPAIEWLANRLSKNSNINCKIEVSGDEQRLAPDDELNIFRIVQEALNNIRRHSEAHNVAINIAFNSTNLMIALHDDGKGFSFEPNTAGLAAKGKLGLIGMQQRAEFIKGTLDIESKTNQGSTILLIKPY